MRTDKEWAAGVAAEISKYRVEHPDATPCLRTMAEGVVEEPDGELVNGHWVVPQQGPTWREVNSSVPRVEWYWRVLHAPTGLAVGPEYCHEAAVVFASALPSSDALMAAVGNGDGLIFEARQAADEIENAREAELRKLEDGAIVAEELSEAEDELEDAREEYEHLRLRVDKLRAELAEARKE
jgi:hypothetical protein